MATLYINKSESRCGFCNKGADPHELSHETIIGWYANRFSEKGCGEVFDSVSSDYIGFPGLSDAIKEMRPDLPWVGVD